MPGKKVMEFGDFGEGGLKIRIVSSSEVGAIWTSSTMSQESFNEAKKNVSDRQT